MSGKFERSPGNRFERENPDQRNEEDAWSERESSKFESKAQRQLRGEGGVCPVQAHRERKSTRLKSCQ